MFKFGRKKKKKVKKEFVPEVMEEKEDFAKKRKEKRHQIMDLGQTKLDFGDDYTTQVMEHMTTFDDPQVTDEEIQEAGGTIAPVHARVNKRANSARALIQLAQDEDADPTIRQMAQEYVEEQGLESWLELYDYANELRSIGQVTQSYGFGNITSQQMHDQLEDLRDDLGETGTSLVDTVQKFVPMKEQFVQDKSPEQTMGTIKDDDGKIYKVSEDEVKDMHGNIIIRPTSGNDLRAMNTTANTISQFFLDKVDQDKAHRGGQYIHTAIGSSSLLMREVYGTALSKMSGFPMGREGVQTYNEKQMGIDTSSITF